MNSDQFARVQSRRKFFQEWAGGIGTVALWHLLALEGRTAKASDGLPGANPLEAKPPHFEPRAKNVIFLFMAGGPSQVDLFDPKPEMTKWNGQPLPGSMLEGLRFAFIKPTSKVWASPRVFTRHGACGMEFCDWLPHLATRADDICMIRSMYSDIFNHHPAQLMLNCGSSLVGRPAMGAWVIYGLGSESQNLPGFVVLRTGDGNSAGTGNWGNGFLPSSFQGVPFRSSGDPVLYLSNPSGVSGETQRAKLEAIRDLNQLQYVDTQDMEIVSRIASYELAFRMQTAAPELMDFSRESPETLKQYGIDKQPTRPFATNCLLARRMVERGVRFVALLHGTWDDHADLNKNLRKNCEIVDQPTAALLGDLKQRGLLDSTLVLWGGEFGRTPMVENRRPVSETESWGRDHHPFGFSMWMAGGGIKAGQVFGKTDDFGFNVVEDKVPIHDLHATILHCLGLNHERLTFRSQGRDFRLTDTSGRLVPKLLA
jgi:hypothetical protein